MRREMFFPTGNEEREGIINKNPPIKQENKKKVILQRGIEESEYEEITSFLSEQNMMSSGNYTLLSRTELERYRKLNTYIVLLRNEISNKLFGTIFSIPLPIKCTVSAGITNDEEYMKDQIIMHGCTTFLNVQSTIRGFKMCMLLIRELAQYGFENKVLCSYQLSSFKMCETAVEISTWTRPINLQKSLLLGFTFPKFNELSQFHNNRSLYKCKVPKGYTVAEVKKGNMEEALKFYKKLVGDKKFVFYPDVTFLEKWIKEYPTYIVKKENKNVGFFSIGTINCRMITGIEGRLCLPLLFNSVINEGDKVLKCLLSIAHEKDYDALYGNQVGDLTQEVYESANCIPNSKKSYFSLYNNSMKLTEKDIYVPLI